MLKSIDVNTPEPDEIPLAPFAENKGDMVILRCRTLAEAYLLCEELEKVEVLPVLPNDEEMQAEYEAKGYVELRVSARAYDSVADLRSVVEFQYKQLRSERRLPTVAKLLGIVCGATIPFGLLIFVFLFFNYKRNGYQRMARQFKYSLFAGVVLIVVIGVCFAVLESHTVGHH